MAATKYYTKGTRSFLGLKNLIDISRDHFTKLTLEALVTTGFEDVAKDELLEKFGEKSRTCTTLGRIYFNTTLDKYEKYRQLKCVERTNIIAGFVEVCLGGKEEDKDKDLAVIKNTVNVFDWDKVLTVWKEVFDFRGDLYPTREEYELAVSLKNSETHKKPQKCETEDDVVFQSKNLYYEKTDLEKYLDSVVDTDSEEEICNDNQNLTSDPKTFLRFRVTCVRVGPNHSFSSTEAATVFGGYLQDKFNWIVDLSNYDLEIILNIVNENVYVGVALNKMSNHFRNITYFGPTTLRATICSNLLRLCRIKPGDIVIDPMCGGGSIIIEGCLNYKNVYFVGGDEHEKAVERTKNNVSSLGHNYNIDGLQWDATHLPLKNKAVDVFVSDFPFGKRCGSKKNNKNLYKLALREIARVLRPRTGRCVILTSDRRSFELAFSQTNLFFKFNNILHVNIGGLSAYCAVLGRTKEEFDLKLSRKERKLLASKEWLKKKLLEKSQNES